MPIWYKNEPDPVKRVLTLFIYEDDGVTPAPAATGGFTVDIRYSGAPYAAAGGTLTNVGVDGEWEYQALQSETDIDASEIVVAVSKVGFLTAKSIAMLQDPTNPEVAAALATALWQYIPDTGAPEGCATFQEQWNTLFSVEVGNATGLDGVVGSTSSLDNTKQRTTFTVQAGVRTFTSRNGD